MLTSKARDSVIEGEFSQALHHLQRAYIIPGFRYISADAPFEMNLLASQIEIGLINGPTALLAAKTARDQISRGEKKLSRLDRDYLLAYCDALIDYCAHWKDDSDPPPDRERKVSQLGVSSHNLNKFPLPNERYFI